MLNFDQIEFRKLNFSGLQTLISWAEIEGWNPGPHDAQAFWATDPDGYYGYFYNKELIGGGSIVSYNQKYGFMGFFIIKPEYRSKGIGRRLWYERRDKLIARLNPGSTIGMDGVIAMQKFYGDGGFKIAFRDERQETIGRSFNKNKYIEIIHDEDFSVISEYDQKYFGTNRSKFLNHWLKLPESNAFMYNDGSGVEGYAVIRKAKRGHKIGPLFAQSYEIAEKLYQACLNSAINEYVYIDIPVINKLALNLIKNYNTKYVFECARMYYGPPPEININNIYGITTFELG